MITLFNALLSLPIPQSFRSSPSISYFDSRFFHIRIAYNDFEYTSEFSVLNAMEKLFRNRIKNMVNLKNSFVKNLEKKNYFLQPLPQDTFVGNRNLCARLSSIIVENFNSDVLYFSHTLHKSGPFVPFTGKKKDNLVRLLITSPIGRQT